MVLDRNALPDDVDVAGVVGPTHHQEFILTFPRVFVFNDEFVTKLEVDNGGKALVLLNDPQVGTVQLVGVRVEIGIYGV